MSYPYQSLKTRLEKRRRIDPITNCWLWTGTLTSTGHGKLRFNYKFLLVHRAAMHVYKDFSLDDSALICHARFCPNRHCFNPEHLYIGSKRTNARDAMAIGKFRPWGRER